MSNHEASIVFDQERAAAYDRRFAKLAALKDALHLLIRLVLSDLPADARILCVGAGTGAELLELARAFPQWRFTAVEPSAPMLEVCRRRAEESGIATRCSFFQGYLDALPDSEPFDAATSVLVSHFILQPRERSDFYRQIADRLRSGGCLVSADLAADMSSASFDSRFEMWARAWRHADVPAQEIEGLRASFGRAVAVLPPQEVESIISAGGFSTPVLFFQALFIHAWYARRAP